MKKIRWLTSPETAIGFLGSRLFEARDFCSCRNMNKKTTHSSPGVFKGWKINKTLKSSLNMFKGVKYIREGSSIFLAALSTVFLGQHFSKHPPNRQLPFAQRAKELSRIERKKNPLATRELLRGAWTKRHVLGPCLSAVFFFFFHNPNGRRVS